MKLWSLAGVAASLLGAGVSHAQDPLVLPATHDRAEPPAAVLARDPLVPASISVAAAGMVTAIAGAVTWGQAEPPMRCGLIGCVQGPDRSAERGRGSAVVGVGTGLAVAGAIGLGVTLGDPLGPGEERDGPVAATTGFLLTSMSAGALAGGLMFGGLGSDRPDYAQAVPFFVTSGVLASVGIPLFVAGVSPEDEAERREEARVRNRTPMDRERERSERLRLERAIERGEIETEMRSPAMVGIGTALIVAGVGGGCALAVRAANVDGGGFMDFSGLERLAYAGGAVASLGAGLGAGTALIVAGVRQVPTSTATVLEAPAPPPRVSLGLGTASIDGTF